MPVIFALALAFFATVSAPRDAAAAEPVPVASFFARPALAKAALSPSGRWLAVTAAAANGRLALAVVDSDGKQAPLITASFSDVDVVAFEWVNDDRLVFSVADLLVGVGEQRIDSGVYAVRRDGSERRLLSRPSDRYHSLRLLSVPRGGGNSVILGDYGFDTAGELDAVDVVRVNVVDGRSELLSQGRPARTRGWLIDPNGEPRGVVSSADGRYRIHWRGKGESGWREIASYPLLTPGFAPFAIDGAGELYGGVAEGESRTTVLKRFDFAAKRPVDDAIARTPGFDFSGELILGGADSRPVGLRVLTDARTTVWFDAGMKRIQAAVDAKFPGRVNVVSCPDCAAPDVVLVNSYSDRDPGSVWVFRPSNDEWHLIGRRRPTIEPAQMARLDLHRIRARDGREIPVWVTTPPNAPPQAPAIVLVHGGPQVRGVEWQWNADAQFLASRGYVVIEPEFRGSDGYGASHVEAGWKHWGDTMQDDNADALAWAVGRGLVDPARACIAGASYGGYATLMSLVRHPDTYRCGVAWVAVTDPRLLFNEEWASDSQAEGRRYFLPAVVGDPVKDADLLRRSAPSEHAAEIKAPVLLAFGRDDRRVPIEHGVRMRSALTAAGRPPEWIVYEGEGHGWQTTEHQVDFWRRVEAFLAKQLKP